MTNVTALFSEWSAMCRLLVLATTLQETVTSVLQANRAMLFFNVISDTKTFNGTKPA